MNKSTHKPIFDQKKPQGPPSVKPPSKQEVPASAAPVVQGGGRSANITTPEMIKKIELSILGRDNQVGPFSGYNSTVQSNTSLSTSRVYENPKENPLMQSFVKEVVSYEVNERYKILIDRNQKLEEQLKQSHKRIEQLESSFSQNQSELQSHGNNTILDISDIQSAIENNQQIEELTQNYTSMKKNVDSLQKQLNEDIKQYVVNALDNIQEKDSKMSSIVEQMNKKYENKLQLIEQQIKLFSNKGGNNESVEGVDELTVKRLQAEQLQVQSDIQQLKSLLETQRNEQMVQINQDINGKIKGINKDFEELKSSIVNIKQEVDSKLVATGKNQEVQNQQDYKKQIEQLQKSIQELASQKQSTASTASTAELERENKDLKEKFYKYQRDTSSQIEELRRLILSNPEMMMEASKGAFRRQATYGEEYGGVYDGANFQMYQDYKTRQVSQEQDQDLVEIATFGSMNDSKVSNQGDYEFRAQNYKNDDNMQKSLTFGGKAKPNEEKEKSKQEEDWLQKYNQHQENVDELINKFTNSQEGSLPQPKQNNYVSSEPLIQQKSADDLTIKTKQRSQESERQLPSNQGITSEDKSSFDDIKINYQGIKTFVNNYQQPQQQQEEKQQKQQETEEQQILVEVEDINEEELGPQKDMYQSEVSLASGTSHEQILHNLGYNNPLINSQEDNLAFKLTQSVVSNNMSQLKQQPVQPQFNQSPQPEQQQQEYEDFEEEVQGETIVFDPKSKKFNTLNPDGTSDRILDSTYVKKELNDQNQMTRSGSQNQLIEVNVHDLSFKDEENSRLYESLCSSTVSYPRQPALQQRASQKDLAYSIIVTQPPQPDLIQEQEQYYQQRQYEQEQQNKRKDQEEQDQTQTGIEEESKEVIAQLSPQAKSFSPHPAQADETVDDDEFPEPEDDTDEQKIETKQPVEQIQDNSEKEQQFVVQNKVEYVLSSVVSGNQEGESQQSDLQSQDFMHQESKEDEEEVVYQLDENGFLMDEKGNYILGDDGEMVKLGDDDIQYLRQTNMLEEY